VRRGESVQEGRWGGDDAREFLRRSAGNGGSYRGRCKGDRAPVIATVNVSTVVTTPAGLVYLPVNVMFLPETASMYSCDGGDSM
jgi:hypothetical protein